MNAIEIMVGLEMDRIRGILRLAKEYTDEEKTHELLMAFIRFVDGTHVSGELKEFALTQIKATFKVYGVIQ